MRARILTLSLLAVTLLQTSFAQPVQPRYSITISIAKTTVKASAETRVRIVQTNTTDQNQMFWIEKIAGLHGEYLYLINVWLEDGTKPPRSKYFQEVRDDKGNFMPGTAGNGVLIRKKPGESIESSLDLNELYDLKPGKYTVQLYQNDDIAKLTVKSNIITVTVTPEQD